MGISKYSKFTKNFWKKIVFRNVRPSSTKIIECWPIRKHFDLDHFLGFILIIVLDLTRTARLPSRLVPAMSRNVLVSRILSVFRYNRSHSFDYWIFSGFYVIKMFSSGIQGPLGPGSIAFCPWIAGFQRNLWYEDTCNTSVLCVYWNGL